jgi:3-methylcrotonyl-CoA carboxylase alpha subunit
MEMNTRLQVEHPVTEEITGEDLVEWQLRVASGEPLPKRQDELSINGHAIEARLYAEDPAKGFLPSVGRLEQFHFPDEHVRIDTGVEQGSVISPFYDPMIAKIVVHHETREDALSWMADRLEGVATWPVKSNAGFLRRAVMHPAFVRGEVTTGFIDQHSAELKVAERPSAEALRQAARELLEQFQDSRVAGLSGFRLNSAPSLRVRMNVAGDRVEVEAPDEFRGEVYSSRAALGVALVTEDGDTFGVPLDEPRGTGATYGLHDGEIEAPMPGKVTAVEISQGEKVVKGQRLLTLEAMKMEHALTAPFDGTVAELTAAPGQQVTEGQLLVRVESEEGTS